MVLSDFVRIVIENRKLKISISIILISYSIFINLVFIFYDDKLSLLLINSLYHNKDHSITFLAKIWEGGYIGLRQVVGDE